MAEGHKYFAVAEAFVNRDVPLRGDRRQNAQSLGRVRPSHVRQVAEGAAVADIFGGVMGGKRYRLERERRRNQQQNRKPP